jgi:hypothetical protein
MSGSEGIPGEPALDEKSALIRDQLRLLRETPFDQPVIGLGLAEVTLVRAFPALIVPPSLTSTSSHPYHCSLSLRTRDRQDHLAPDRREDRRRRDGKTLERLSHIGCAGEAGGAWV